jgi:hypothetical protein
MPLQNRVTPFGEIVAVAGRGTLMGNRGILHDPDKHIVRDSQVRRWIACLLEFHGRHRDVMQPNSYTELFFLDEATALAAGHRPCAECRHVDFQHFQACWKRVRPNMLATADAIDATLHVERRSSPGVKRTHSAKLATLPDGTYIALDREAWLIKGNQLAAWSPTGYHRRRRRPTSGEVIVLTPASIVAVVRGGYAVRVHPTAVD